MIHPPTNFHLRKRPIVGRAIIGYGLLHIAASLLSRGFNVAVLNLEDALLRGLTPSDIERSIQTRDPLVVGIELNWLSSSRGAIQTAAIVKKACPMTHIVIGGTHASIFSREIIRKHSLIVDAVLKGEAEKTFPDIVENLEEKGSFGNVGGLVFVQDKQLKEIPFTKSDLYTNIDDIPPYSYRSVQHVTLGLPVQARHSLAINCTRGPCTIDCAHCIGGQTHRYSGRTCFTIHSPEWIVNQINLLTEEGIKSFQFQDLLFLSGKKRLKELATAIKSDTIEKDIQINMTAVPGILDRETLEYLSQSGVYSIDYGCESGSNRILTLINRPTTNTQILDAMKATAATGIIPWTFWLTGLPDETQLDINDTLTLINQTLKVGALPRWITPLVILPGTRLFEHAQDLGIHLRLKTFEDFSVYSDLETRAISWYPNAISHETQRMNRYDILHSTMALKFDIFRRRDDIVSNYMKNFAHRIIDAHPHLSAERLASNIERSIRYLLKAFF